MRQVPVDVVLGEVAALIGRCAPRVGDEYLERQLAVAAELLRYLAPQVLWDDGDESVLANALLRLAPSADDVSPQDGTHPVDRLVAARRAALNAGDSDTARLLDTVVNDLLDRDLERLARKERP